MSIKKRFINLVSCSVFIFSSAASAAIVPPAPKVAAKGFMLIDFNTHTVLAEGNADMQLPPASLTKMMTSYVIGKEIENGSIAETDMVPISENAWAKNFPDSSKMFIEVGKKVSVADLNRGIIIQSGNDACVAMAEYIAGSEDGFAQVMNEYARQLEMSATNFVNSHGYPHPDNYTSPRDMSKLAIALIKDVPDEYALYSEKSFTFNNIKQYNRNSLLWDKSMKVDGIKTGHTEEAGYSLVSSATKGDMRLVAVVMGASSERSRSMESKKLLNYGFRFFETITPYKAGDSFVDHRVYMGDKETVSLGINQDTPITIPRGQLKNLKANFKLEKELKAPLTKGEVVGKLFLQLEGQDIAEYPLVTLQEINEGGLFDRMKDYIKLQISGEGESS